MSDYKHKWYLNREINSHKTLILTLILPAFLWGWQMGKAKGGRFGNIVLQVLRVTMFSAFTRTKKHLGIF
ncbi:MAG: hypothetical protein CK424_06605 [Legionella sp.]|nr:MAG: hypothetical protein CK424_06605 [Legionella sp.]